METNVACFNPSWRLVRPRLAPSHIHCWRLVGRGARRDTLMCNKCGKQEPLGFDAEKERTKYKDRRKGMKWARLNGA